MTHFHFQRETNIENLLAFVNTLNWPSYLWLSPYLCTLAVSHTDLGSMYLYDPNSSASL